MGGDLTKVGSNKLTELTRQRVGGWSRSFSVGENNIGKGPVRGQVVVESVSVFQKLKGSKT